MSYSSSDTCTIQIHHFEENFRVFHNDIWENDEISLEAAGLLGYLLSRPRNWKIHVWQLNDAFKNKKGTHGKDRIHRLMKELREAGYVHYQKKHRSDGKWEHIYIVTNKPFKEDIKKIIPEPDFPALVATVPAKPAIITNKELPNKELNKSKDYIAQTATRQSYEITFSFEDQKFQGIEKTDLEAWKELYPAVDIMKELKRMREWIISNQSKTKSKKKWRQFINNWLKKTNDTEINKQAYQGAVATPKEEEKLGKTKIKYKPNGDAYEV